jgi:hypothetical protein
MVKPGSWLSWRNDLADQAVLPMQLHEFTIKRSEWHRGKSGARLSLEHSEDTPAQRCCLGFAMLSVGLDERQIHNSGTVHQLVCEQIVTPTGLGVFSGLVAHDGNTFIASAWATQLMKLNDARLVRDTVYGNRLENEADRERMLTEAFAKKNVIVHFVD